MAVSTNKSLTDLSAKPGGYFSSARSEMVRFIPATAKRILDVGCGEGAFGSHLKEKLGAEVWGAELIQSAADVASQRLDNVICGDIVRQLAQLPNEYFDCVIFNDVIEHIVDPYSMLFEVKQKLTRNGVVVCSIPNVRYFRNLFNLVVRSEWRYEECGILDKTHLRFFTKKSISEMFKSLGYEVVSLEGINRTPSWKVAVFNFVSLGLLHDTRYMQFACVARPLPPK